MKLKVLFLSALLGVCTASGQVPVVSKALFLSVDVSGSISTSEYNLQKTGYVNAFASPVIQNLFDGTGFSLAVKYSEWAEIAPGTEVGWTIIDSPLSAQAFANALAAASRSTGVGNLTGMANAINYATSDLGLSLGQTFTLAQGGLAILDVSADGTDNVAPSGAASVAAARDNALANGFDTINALAITVDVPSLAGYMQNNVQSANGFTIESNSFEAFETAILNKIFTEITGGEIPEPTTIGLLAIGAMAGFVMIRRRKGNAAVAA